MNLDCGVIKDLMFTDEECYMENQVINLRPYIIACLMFVNRK